MAHQQWIKADDVAELIREGQREVRRRGGPRGGSKTIDDAAHAEGKRTEYDKTQARADSNRKNARDRSDRDAERLRRKGCTAAERFEWLMVMSKKGKVEEVREESAPDAVAWEMFCRMKGDKEYERSFWDEVLKREVRRADAELKRAFADDGRSMEARLKELDTMLSDDDLLPQTTPAAGKVMRAKQAKKAAQG